MDCALPFEGRRGTIEDGGETIPVVVSLYPRRVLEEIKGVVRTVSEANNPVP